jgi:hypothetical protein
MTQAMAKGVTVHGSGAEIYYQNLHGGRHEKGENHQQAEEALWSGFSLANLSVLLDQGGEIGEKRSFKHPAIEKAPDKGLDECIRKALKENPLFA